MPLIDDDEFMDHTFIRFADSFVDGELLGVGATGTVYLEDDVAVKIPFILNDYSREEGVVRCISFTQHAIYLELMYLGSLYDFLVQYPVARSTRLDWAIEIASALVCVHDRRVIVADLGTYNLLLGIGLVIKIADFGSSYLLPLNADMETAVVDGYSVRTDIARLGAILFEVVTNLTCPIGLFKNGRDGIPYPRPEDLPRTDVLWMGDIIQKCWTVGGYKNVREVLYDLERTECYEGLAYPEETFVFE